MLCGMLDASVSNDVNAVFPGRLDRALGHLVVDRRRHRGQDIGDAFSLVLVSALGLIRSMSFAFLLTILSSTRMMCALLSLDLWIG